MTTILAQLGRVTRAFRSWSSRRGFVEGRHDAELRGSIDGVEVVIDTGVRASGLSPALVRLALETGETSAVLRPADADAPSDSPRTLALRAVVRRHGVTVWLDPDRIEIHRASNDPDILESAVQDVIEACRAAARVGAYR